MKQKRIRDPLPGEQIVALEPGPDRLVDAGWRRRLNLYTGRALTADALGREQAWRAGHLTMLGQGFSSGVIHGLEVDRDDSAERLAVSPGVGLTARGEELRLSEPLSVAVTELSVVSGTVAVDDATTETSLGTLPVEERPAACFLLLEPIEGRRIGDFDSTDPCERNPENEAFEDQQRVDGARLLLYAWPEEVLPLPEPRDARWRNRLAYSLFDLEALVSAAEIPPWEGFGMPLGLLALDDEARVDFFDRSALRRLGGQRRRGQSLVVGAGSPFLHRARFEQFAEHLAELEAGGLPIEELAANFRHLPPVGTLPAAAMDSLNRQERFFPPQFRVEAVPVPLEQVGPLIQATAPLAALDTAGTEVVRLAVPVPQQHFEPDLLLEEAVDPVFAETIAELTEEEEDRHNRQRNVAGKVRALGRAILGTMDGPAEPEGDDEGFVQLADDVASELDYGTALDDNFQPQALGLASIRDALEDTRVERHLTQLDALGVSGFLQLLERLIRRAEDQVDLGFLRARTETYRVRQWILGNLDATRLATSPVLAGIAQGDTAPATEERITAFFERNRGRLPTRPDEPPDAPPIDGRIRAGGLSREARVSDVGARRIRGGDFVREAPVAEVGAGRRRLDPRLAPPLTATPVFGQPRTPRGAPTRDRPAPGLVIDRPRSTPSRPDPTFGRPDLFARPDVVEAPDLFERPGLVDGPDLFEATPVGPRGPRLFDAGPRSRLPESRFEQDIAEQAPIVGRQLDFRTLTVAERLDRSPGIETRGFALRRKFETVVALQALSEQEFNLEGVRVANVVLTPEEREELGIEGPRGPVTLSGFDAARLTDDPEPVDGDEAAFFGAAIALLDDSINLMRALEGRVDDYRRALRLCRSTLEEIGEDQADAESRLALLDRRLAETRHDLEVSDSLLAEETRRVTSINRRRRRVLAESVPFLLFHRPLEATAEAGAPVRELYAAPREEPIAACAGRAIEPPTELRQMVDGLRDAPLRWFPALRRLLRRLDRLDLVRRTLVQAQRRAQQGPRLQTVAPATLASPLGVAVFQVARAQQQVLHSYVQRTARADLTGLGFRGWNDARRAAEEVVSIGDLIESGHGRSNVARQAAAQLEQLAGVATCLYAGFSEAVPAARLEWAQRLSQYDDPLDLRNLARLPGWSALEFEERRELQALVAWLHSRVDPAEPEAVTWINDLVRVAILLASHAPVDEIISGAVAEETPVEPGSTVRVLVDVTRVRIGMGALLSPPGAAAILARVEDLDDDSALIRVADTAPRGLRLARGGQVRFTAPLALAEVR